MEKDIVHGFYLRIKTDRRTRERYNENWLIELADS